MNRSTAVLVLVPPTWIGGLGAMRSLGRLGVRVYGLSHRRRLVPNASRYCAGTIAAGEEGRPLGDPARIVADLLKAADQLGHGTLLLAGTDEWAVFLAAHADALSSRYRFPMMPAALVAGLASKDGLYRLATAHQVPTPRVAVPRNAADALDLAGTLQYPVMLKPVHSRPHVTYKAVASSAHDLLERYRLMEEAPDTPNVLLQEYIPGTDADVWMFNGYFNGSSECLAGFTGQKLRQHPAHMGHCSLGVLRENRLVAETTCRFLAAVGYRGVVDIGYRFDRRDGQYKILDVNPRLGGAFRLFVDRQGLDVVRAFYLDLTRQPVAAVQPNDGRRWLREDSELVAFNHYRRTDGLTLRGWVGSWKGVQETSTFTLRDPLPFVASMWLLLKETVRGRVLRKRGLRTAQMAISVSASQHVGERR